MDEKQRRGLISAIVIIAGLFVLAKKGGEPEECVLVGEDFATILDAAGHLRNVVALMGAES
jgi:hypothetical protein